METPEQFVKSAQTEQQRKTAERRQLLCYGCFIEESTDD